MGLGVHKLKHKLKKHAPKTSPIHIEPVKKVTQQVVKPVQKIVEQHVIKPVIEKTPEIVETVVEKTNEKVIKPIEHEVPIINHEIVQGVEEHVIKPVTESGEKTKKTVDKMKPQNNAQVFLYVGVAAAIGVYFMM
jgi:hypothetical protein